MSMLLVAIAVAFNLIIIVWKFRNKRITDGLIDTILLIAVAKVFAVSTETIIIGTIGSFAVSFYLLIKPPKIAGF